MIAKRFPEIGIVGERDILCGLAVSEAISVWFLIGVTPAFLMAETEINLSINNALAIVEIGLDGAIGIEHAASAAELYTPLTAVTIGCYEVDAIFKCASHPPATRAFFIKPVGGKEQDICTAQDRNTGSLEVHRIHTDQAS